MSAITSQLSRLSPKLSNQPRLRAFSRPSAPIPTHVARALSARTRTDTVVGKPSSCEQRHRATAAGRPTQSLKRKNHNAPGSHARTVDIPVDIERFRCLLRTERSTTRSTAKRTSPVGRSTIARRVMPADRKSIVTKTQSTATNRIASMMRYFSPSPPCRSTVIVILVPSLTFHSLTGWKVFWRVGASV